MVLMVYGEAASAFQLSLPQDSRRYKAAEGIYGHGGEVDGGDQADSRQAELPQGQLTPELDDARLHHAAPHG